MRFLEGNIQAYRIYTLEYNKIVAILHEIHSWKNLISKDFDKGIKKKYKS